MTVRSQQEQGRLNGVLPELDEKERKLRARASFFGIEYIVPAFGGLRTFGDQQRLLQWRDDSVAVARTKGFTLPSGGKLPPGDAAANAARYPVAPRDKSFHAQGAAFDIKIVRHNERTLDDAYRRVALIARDEIGLRPGLFFRTRDPFHFELPTTLDKVKAVFATLVRGRGVQLGGVLAVGIGLAFAVRALAR